MIVGGPSNATGASRVHAVSVGWDDSAEERERLADGRDGVAAVRDVAADGRDGLAFGRDGEADIRDRTADGRDGVADGRDSLAAMRDDLAALRDDLAALRDRVAERREQVADDRDRAADVRDDRIGAARSSSSGPAGAGRDEIRVEALRGRDVAVGGRLQADHDRENALAERDVAAGDRQRAADLRGAAIVGRRIAEVDRGEALFVRDAALSERESAAEDRQQAGLDRLAELDQRLTWDVVLAMLASVPDAVVAVDADGVITYVNDQGESLFGWSRVELLGRHIEVLVPDDQTAQHPSLRSMYSANPVPRVMAAGIELSARRRDGSEFPAEISLSACDSGPERWMLAAIRDMTNARQIAHQLEIARSEAVHANAAKNEFLSRMSHELRTPLNAILGFGQLLELDPLRDDQRTAVGHIVSAGRHLLELVDEVLDIARIEGGVMRLSLEPIDLCTVTNDTIELMRPLATQREIHLHVDEDSISVHLRADQQRLRQVLLNLISNAIKYNRPGGDVHVSGQARPAGRFRVMIRDRGYGLSGADTKLLFEPFERLAAEHGDVEGVGLGLALCKQLVTLMGGDIGVTSRIGEGSIFWIELAGAELRGTELAGTGLTAAELAATELNGPVTVASVQSGSTPDDIETRRSTILYVEDNLSNVRLLERIVARRPGVTLIVAMQGSVALELATAHHPDLVLLDLHLPDMNGEQVLRQLKANPSTARITVVIVSADASTGAARRLRDLGAAHYITKPFDIPRILSIIDSAAEPYSRPASRPAGPGSAPNTIADIDIDIDSDIDIDIDRRAGDLDPNTFLHDLNNHLGIIINYSEMLLRNTLPSSARADVQEISGAAQRAADQAAAYRSTILHDPPDPAPRLV